MYMEGQRPYFLFVRKVSTVTVGGQIPYATEVTKSGWNNLSFFAVMHACMQMLLWHYISAKLEFHSLEVSLKTLLKYKLDSWETKCLWSGLSLPVFMYICMWHALSHCGTIPWIHAGQYTEECPTQSLTMSVTEAVVVVTLNVPMTQTDAAEVSLHNWLQSVMVTETIGYTRSVACYTRHTPPWQYACLS